MCCNSFYNRYPKNLEVIFVIKNLDLLCFHIWSQALYLVRPQESQANDLGVAC